MLPRAIVLHQRYKFIYIHFSMKIWEKNIDSKLAKMPNVIQKLNFDWLIAVHMELRAAHYLGHNLLVTKLYALLVTMNVV